ncbi:hypothetical protein OZ410_12315 [Robiginitalea sp. M366]|uniref:ATP-binding protein n=1 Tax=Robiginitalea aestuariiviva TaxID=3036903 RepID=UPI00240D68F4|nr:ATP-binding protein [Robiginitalea aestuariiviva]MDG1573105.1 hypothetical protein [Robiginitalea aestuariiviva]
MLLLLGGWGCNRGVDARTRAERQAEISARIAALSDPNLPESAWEVARETLEKELLDTDGDSIQAYGLVKLLETYRDQKEDPEYRALANRALSLAQDRRDTLAIGQLFSEIGMFHYRRNHQDSAYSNFTTAYDLFIRLDSLYLAGHAKRSIAATKYFTGDYLSADENVVQAIDLFEAAGDHPDSRFQIARCYSFMGSISSAMNQYDKALEAQEKALELLAVFPDQHGMRHTLYNNMSNAYLQKEDYLRALRYLNLILNAPPEENISLRTLALALINQGRAYFGLKNYGAAEKSYREALEYIQQSADLNNRLPRNYYYMAELFLAQEDTARASAYIQLGREWAEQLKEMDGLKDILVLQSRISPALAPANIERLDMLRDSLLNLERDNRNKMARLEMQTDQYIERNEELARRQILWIGLAMGVLLLGASILIIITQRVRNQKLRFQQQQQEANQEIFNLMLSQNEKVEEGKHEVQKRISEDLHDGVLGEMNGIRMVLLGLNGKTDEKSVALRAQAIEKLKSIQEEIRGISHELSDAAYRKFHNFILSIEDLVTDYCDSAGLEHHLEYSKEVDWDDLRGETKINLYRIIQECLQNTIKHAGATRVEVELGAEGSDITVLVRDNGVGFLVKRGKKGIGHKNIASRVSKIKGRWDLKSSPGAGTEITIAVPYHDMTSPAVDVEAFISV